MKLTAMLAWYDERIEDLERCILSLPEGGADRLVALDGSYARWPDANVSSPKAQAAAIRSFAKRAGLEVEVHVPRALWRGQVEKRDHLIRLAAEGSDWIAGVDADHVWHGSREAVRCELDGLGVADAVDVEFYTPKNPDRLLVDCAAGQWHADLAGVRSVISGFFRVLPEMRVERYHWWYSAVKDGGRYWLWGGDGTYPKVRVHQLDAPFFVEHRCLFREDKHILANREFCADRERIVAATGQEDAE